MDVNTNDDNISLDTVLNTKTGADREPINPPAGEPPVNTPPANEPSSEDEDFSSSEETVNKYKSLFTSPDDKEDREIRNAILEEYKGTDFNENGDLVDAEGKVLKTFKDLVKELDVQEEEITLDDKGNQVNDKGEIVKTKEELQAESSVVNNLHNNSEYEFLDEEGNVKVYSDDDNGFLAFSEDVANAKLESFKSTFFSQNKELAEISKHLLAGGTLADFKEPVDYSKIDPKTLTTDDKLKTIRESYIAAEMSESRINNLLTMTKDSNNVDAEYEEAVKALDRHREAVIEERQQNYEATIAENNKKIEQHWSEVEQIVNKGDLGNVNIPDADKKAFFSYLSDVADDNGNSKDMLDAKNETKEQQLAFSFMRFKGYDLSKLITDKARTTSSKSLRERIKQSEKFKTTSVNNASSNAKSGDGNVTIDSLLG